MSLFGKETLKARYKRDDNERSEVMRKARLAAALTKPWVLPPKDQDKSQELPQPYQSVGPRGMTNLEGRMLTALFPPTGPWFKLDPSAEILHDPNVSDDFKQQLQQALYLRELMIVSILESANMQQQSRQRRSGFRTRKRMALSQVLVTGDVLERLDDEYRVQVFRRDQYVTKRDSAGDVLYHITREKIDPMSLDDEKLGAAKLKRDKLEKISPSARMMDLYTAVEWQPDSEDWLIRQELNDQQINESEEQISPYFSTTFELMPGEDYGRGFAELNLGDLRSTNELNERMLDFAATASKHLWVLDDSSTIRDQDMAKPTGSVIRGKVAQGIVQDAAMLKAEKNVDFNVVFQTTQQKTNELARAMLLESEVQPRGERVTATQVQRIAAELEGALGGLYAPIADDQQMPLLRRTMHQLQRDNLLPELPEDSIDINVLTGLSALTREVDAGKKMELAQVISNFGPEAMQKIDIGVLVDSLARDKGIDEPGLVKSDEEIARERAQQTQQALAQQAGQQAIETAGEVVSQQAAPQNNQRTQSNE